MTGVEHPAVQIPWYDEGFRVLETSINGERGSELHALRARAHGELMSIGLPTAKSEDWKYTDIREIERRNFTLAKRNVLQKSEEKELVEHSLLTPSEGIQILTVDGFVSTSLEELRAQLPKGVEITTLRELFSEKKTEMLSLYKEHFGKIASSEEDAVVSLNTAFMQDGILLHVKKGVDLSAPISIHHVASGEKADTAIFPRLLVVVEEGGRAAILEHFTTEASSAGLTSSVTEIVVQANAHLDHYQVGEEAEDHVRISRISSHQGRDAQLRMHSYTFGGKIIRQEVTPTLQGENGFTGMYGLSVLHGTQHVDNHTVIDHAVPHCESDERYKGIYDGKSKGIFCGTIIVRPDAQKTNAIQNNASVLLSERATVNTKPQLKIWADDVKCTHGATIGQLDDDQLFYLRSRGVTYQDARNMLLRAFAGEVTREIAIPTLRTSIEEKVVAKLSL